MKETIFDIANRLYPDYKYDEESYFARDKFLEGAKEQAKLLYTREEVIVVTSEMLIWLINKIKNPTNIIDPETEVNRIIKELGKE